MINMTISNKPALLVTEPYVPNNQYSQEIDPNAARGAKKNKICEGEVFGTFEPTNKWNETPETAGVTADIKLRLSANPSDDFQVNAQFTVPVSSIDVWSHTVKGVPYLNTTLILYKTYLYILYCSRDVHPCC